MEFIKNTMSEKRIWMTKNDLEIAIRDYVNKKHPNSITDEKLVNLLGGLTAYFQYDPLDK